MSTHSGIIQTWAWTHTSTRLCAGTHPVPFTYPPYTIAKWHFVPCTRYMTCKPSTIGFKVLWRGSQPPPRIGSKRFNRFNNLVVQLSSLCTRFCSFGPHDGANSHSLAFKQAITGQSAGHPPSRCPPSRYVRQTPFQFLPSRRQP